MTDKIRVGLIGANSGKGWSAGTHLPALAAIDDFELRAVCTTRQESADDTARRYGATHALTDAGALAALADVDLVVVSVRAPGHARNVRLAVEAGKAVLCEWPLGIGGAESTELASLAAARGLRGFVTLQGRFAPAMLHAKTLIAQGALGELLSVSMSGAFSAWGADALPGASYLLDRANGVTAVSIIGGHAIDMLSALAGDFGELSAVIANRRTQARCGDTGAMLPKTAPDQLAVAGVMRSGATVSLHIQGGGFAADEFVLDLRGTAGALRIVNPGIPEIMPATLLRAQAPGEALRPVEIPAAFRTAPESLGGGPAVNVAQLYQQLARDIREGTDLTPSFAYAARLRRLLDLMQESSDSGRRIVVPME